MKIKIENKDIEIPVKELSFFGRAKGLMFCRKEKANAILFKMKKPCRRAIHSLFVFFPFLVIWIKDKKTIEIRKVKPFTLNISPSIKFSEMIEIPFNKKHAKIINFISNKK